MAGEITNEKSVVYTNSWIFHCHESWTSRKSRIPKEIIHGTTAECWSSCQNHLAFLPPMWFCLLPLCHGKAGGTNLNKSSEHLNGTAANMYASDIIRKSDTVGVGFHGISCLFPCSNTQLVVDFGTKTIRQRHPTFPELVYVTRKQKMVEHGRTMAAFAFHGNQSKQNRSLGHPLQDSTQSESRWPGCAERILKWTWHKTHKEIPSWGRAKQIVSLCNILYVYSLSLSGVFDHETVFVCFWHLLYLHPTEKETGKQRARSKESVRTVYILGCRWQLANKQVGKNGKDQ